MIYDESLAQLNNESILNDLLSGDARRVKRANDANSDWIRTTVRESGFLGNILAPRTLANSELQHSVHTDVGVKIEEIEPESPGAVNISFEGLPNNYYIRANFAELYGDRIMGTRNGKDVSELRVTKMDIRQVISDQQRKEIERREDTNLIRGVNELLIAPNVAVPATGTVQWRRYRNAVTRETIFEALKTPLKTPNKVPASTVLIYEETAYDIGMFYRDESGGDLSQEMMIDGFTARQFAGRRWLITNKEDLVPAGTMFLFADEKYLGRFYVLQEPTMVIEVHGPMIQFYAYEEVMLGLLNIAGVARVDLTGARVTLIPDS